MALGNAHGGVGSLGRRIGSLLLDVLNSIAESDQRYREEMRLRGVSAEFLKDVGLTRGQLETAHTRDARPSAKLRDDLAATPAE